MAVLLLAVGAGQRLDVAVGLGGAQRERGAGAHLFTLVLGQRGPEPVHAAAALDLGEAVEDHVLDANLFGPQFGGHAELSAHPRVPLLRLFVLAVLPGVVDHDVGAGRLGVLLDDLVEALEVGVDELESLGQRLERARVVGREHLLDHVVALGAHALVVLAQLCALLARLRPFLDGAGGVGRLLDGGPLLVGVCEHLLHGEREEGLLELGVELLPLGVVDVCGGGARLHSRHPGAHRERRTKNRQRLQRETHTKLLSLRTPESPSVASRMPRRYHPRPVTTVSAH
jgi:hypothetical protein